MNSGSYYIPSPKIYYRQAMIISLQTIPVSNQIVRHRYTGRNKVLNSSFIHNNKIKQALYILTPKEYHFQLENW